MADLSFERRGTGRPLVLIHGIGSHWQVWSPILAQLSLHRDVIALDLPGFGGSALPASGVAGSVPWFADRVAAFLDDLGVHRPEMAGSSLGGGVALELGRRGLARSVTAFAPVGFWSTPGRLWCQAVVTAARTGARQLSAPLPAIMNSRAGRSAFCAVFYARPARLSPADALAAARNLAASPGFAPARDAFARLRPWSPDDLGALPTIPVTIAWGTRDAVLPHRPQSRRARAVLPRARHVTVPGCGHLPFNDDPARCAEILLSGGDLRT
ncbi:hydrolase [Actinoplanes sp. OR16]|uniref:alpha/beta fold hydrolase n=1 Tax=Actinoplanes sp. OR16 TaxID=946334 RepID=UPI000F6B996A|nr:alpha/beta fold hydrolase [Actinoplanes sp. OR16]BBH71417.1 hydrolase [Actinoplanes sp. OR16]